MLRGRLDADGLLPPWTEWWPEDAVAELFPNAATKERVTAEQQRVPFSYLAAQIQFPDGWDQIPAAYLRFGDTSAEELADAQGCGWPVRTMAGGHLHMLCDPVGAAMVKASGRTFADTKQHMIPALYQPVSG